MSSCSHAAFPPRATCSPLDVLKSEAGEFLLKSAAEG